MLNFSVCVFVNGTSLDFAKNLKKNVWEGKSLNLAVVTPVLKSMGMHG